MLDKNAASGRRKGWPSRGEETELKEWILMLRERLGNGATKIVLCVSSATNTAAF